MKKLIILGVSLCFAVALFIGYSGFNNENKYVVDSAKLPHFGDAKEVKDSSDLIVEVSKISEKPVSYDLGEGCSDNLTLSNVKIEKVIKPMEGKN